MVGVGDRMKGVEEMEGMEERGEEEEWIEERGEEEEGM